MKMNDQKLYQRIGELLWSIMPEDALEIYYIGCIYPDYSAGGAEWLTKENKIVSFEMGQRPYEVESQIDDLIVELRSLDVFKEKWTHFKFTLTDNGGFNTEFGYIPREDSWVNLYMKPVSDLKQEELDEYNIPLDEWEKRVTLKKQNKL
jgi:hypothetical protein